MMHPRKHNTAGQTSDTSDPVLVDKPDLRQYNRRPKVAPDDVALRRDYVVRRRIEARTIHTRWRVTHGVVDRFGDLVRVYTGACQTCGRWYRVERTPGDVNGRWPSFCSEDCRASQRALSRRRSARRMRAGQTTGTQRPDVPAFDPASVETPYFLADAIVRGRVSSSPAAKAAATAYLAEVPQPRPDTGRHLLVVNGAAVTVNS